jgi:tetratricopeptide (TPR) repeat protein
MRIIFIITFSLSILPAQDHLDALIQDVLHGSRDSAAIYLPTMEQKYPNNPSLMYLKGLLETNGEEAKDVFAKLYNTHPTSEYGDDAVMKVAEYYYAAGLYVQAANWLKKMPIYYSRSEHIERAVKLFLNSLIVSGHKDTAVFYSRVFKRQFPSLDVDGKIKDLLKDFEKADQQKENAKAFASKNSKPEVAFGEIIYDTPIVIIEARNASGIYSLQTGAYSVRENAESQKINLIISGFSARINELYKSNGTLYAVRIGNFDSKEDARKVGVQIKAKLDINTIVITNN